MYQSVVRVVQPTLILSRLCGVCPSALREPFVPLINKLHSLSLALLLVLTILCGGNLYTMAPLNDVTSFLFIVFSLSLALQHWTLLLTPHLFRERLVKFFHIMESVQESLHRLNVRQPPEPTRRSQILWCLSGIHVILFVVVNRIPETWNLLQDVLLISVMSGFYLKLRVLLSLVSGKLELLNWHLDDLNNRWPLFLPRPPDSTFSEFSCVAAWRRSKFVSYHSRVRLVTPEKVREFNKAHFFIFQAYKTLISTTSLDLLSFTVHKGVLITSGIFLVYNDVFTSTSTKVVWSYCLIQMITQLISLLAFTSKIKEQSRKTALLVHDLLDEEGHSPEVLEELEQFSKMLLHRQMTFSAAGFFDFDLKLVSKMASFLAPITLFFVQNNNRARNTRKKPPPP